MQIIALQAETDMFSLFTQNPTNMSNTFEMWLDGNRTTSDVPVRFKFSQSEKLDCIGRQIIQLKVSSFAAFYIS